MFQSSCYLSHPHLELTYHFFLGKSPFPIQLLVVRKMKKMRLAREESAKGRLRIKSEFVLSGIVARDLLYWGFVEDVKATVGGNAEVELAAFLVFEVVSEGAEEACYGGDDDEGYGDVLVGSVARASVGEGKGEILEGKDSVLLSRS
ncbi:hypothetical protein AAC387_Pa11g0253 [Persea americana]